MSKEDLRKIDSEGLWQLPRDQRPTLDEVLSQPCPECGSADIDSHPEHEIEGLMLNACRTCNHRWESPHR
jgi:hypothetical protein